MIDLHTHSLFSDGELLPSELIRRAEVLGYRAIAVTDHADVSNYDFIIPRITRICDEINRENGITALAGIELTHVIPNQIASLARECRKIGARIIVIHGETITEPVYPGTNRAAVESDIDILAHPGLVSDEVVKAAVRNGVFLEISTRRGHSLTNGHVAQLAKRYDAGLVLNTDSHAPEDLMSLENARNVARGAGLSDVDFNAMRRNSERIAVSASGKGSEILF